MKKIGRYEIESEIGVGGMGVVYKAYDPKFESLAAIKTLSAELSADPEFRYRFFAEAKNTRRLRHPNIVDVYDLGEEDGTPYLAMEFLVGEDLKSLISNKKWITLERKIKVMLEVCNGISYAHQMGTIHRDIKPGNIFITSAGQVKILDFGLAKAVSSHSITATDQVMGTPNYMPPEQWKTSKVDQRADIFATGAVFYEFLTYRKAFDGENMEQILYKILNAEPEAIESLNRALPIELSRIIHKALVRDINERYQNMSEMERELELFSHSLEQLKPDMQSEALSAVGRLKQLIEDNRESYHFSLEVREELTRDFPSLFEVMSGEDESVTTWNPPKDYLSLFESCRRAVFQYDRLKALIEKRKQLAPLFRQVQDLAQKSQIHNALEALKDILQEDPAHVEAAALQQQLTAELEKQRLEQQRELQVQELCRNAETRFTSGDLSGCRTLIDEALALKPGLAAALQLQVLVQQKLDDQAALEARSRHAHEALAAARKAARQQDFEKARLEVERARELFPQLPDMADVLEEIARSEQAYREAQERRQKIALLSQEAQSLCASDQLDSAQERIQEILALDPASAPALELKAAVKSRLQVLERSERLLQRARSRFGAGEWAACLKLLDEVLKLRPEYLEAAALQEDAQQRLREQAGQAEKRLRVEEVLSAARKALAARDTVQARKEVANARTVLPDDPKIDQVLEEIQRAETAVALQRKAAKLLEEADALAQEDEFEIAISRLDEILQLEPAHVSARKMKRDYEKRLDWHRHAQELLRTAQTALSSDDLEKCQKQLDELLKSEPEHAAARELQAEVQRRRQEKAELADRRLRSGEALSIARKALAEEDFESARQQLELAHTLDPDSKQLESLQQAADRAWSDFVARRERERLASKLFQQAHVLMNEGEEQGALDQLNMLLALEPAHVEALKLRKEIDGRRMERTRLEKERQARIAANCLRAKEAEAAGDLQRAAEMTRAVLSEEATHTAALQLLERIESQLRKRKETEERKQARIANLMLASRQALTEKRFDQAISTLGEVLSVDPVHAEASELRRQASAAFEAEKLFRERQARGRQEQKLGLRLLHEKRFSEALDCLRRAAESLGEEPEIRGQILEAEGALNEEQQRAQVQLWTAEARRLLVSEDFESARSALLRVLEINPDLQQAQALLTEIDRSQQQKHRRSEIARLLTLSEDALQRQVFQEARARAHEAELLDPQRTEIKSLLERIDQADREAGTRQKIADLLANAQQAFIQQHYDDAGRSLEELLLLDAENKDARDLLRKVRRSQEEKALKIRIVGLLAKSRQALSQEDFEEAEVQARDVLSLDAQNAEALDLLQGIDRARRSLEERNLKTRVAELLAKSRQALSREDFEEAEIRAREVLLLEASNAEAEELLQKIDKTARKKKAQEEIGLLLSQCRQALGREDYEESARCAHEVLRLVPKHQEATALLKRAEKGIRRREQVGKRIPWMPIAAAVVVALAVAGYFIFRSAVPVDRGEIVITSNPADAEVALDNGSTIFKGVIKDGKFPFSVPAGSYTVVTRKNGYVDKRHKITLSKGKNPDITMSLERKLAALRVRTDPPVADARILLDGKDTGVKTGGDGIASIQGVDPGSRVVSVYKEGYIESKGDRTVLADTPNEIKLDMKRQEFNPKLAYLRISVSPSDLPEATVAVEGPEARKTGQTRGGSVSFDELNPGTVKVLVQKEGYKEERKDIAMAAGRATAAPFILLPKPAQLVLRTNPVVADARIRIDNVEKGRTDVAGIFRLDVEPGNRKVSLESDICEPAVDIYPCLPGKPCEITLKLKVLPNVPTAPVNAMLQIISEPDASLFLDGQPAGKIRANRMSEWLNVKPGTVRIKVTKPGYEDSEERQVKLSAGQPTSEQFSLRPVPGNLLFEVTPADAEARIEGKTYRLSDTRRLPLTPGEHDVLIQKPGYRTESRTVKIVSNGDFALNVDLARESTKPDMKAIAVDHTEEFRNLSNWDNPAGWKADGGLHAQGAGKLMLNKMYADFTARLYSVRLLNGKAVTFIIRAKDRQNYYAIRIAGDSAEAKSRGRVLFLVYKDGVPTEKDSRPLVPVEKRLRVLREAPFNISIEARDRQVTVKISSPSIPEVELGRFVDADAYGEGQIGFEITGDEVFEIQRLLVKPIQ